MIVGDWVRRKRGRWHEVESVIAGDAVTQCGRRMKGTLDGSALEVSAMQPLIGGGPRMIDQPQLCKRCA